MSIINLMVTVLFILFFSFVLLSVHLKKNQNEIKEEWKSVLTELRKRYALSAMIIQQSLDILPEIKNEKSLKTLLSLRSDAQDESKRTQKKQIIEHEFLEALNAFISYRLNTINDYNLKHTVDELLKQNQLIDQKLKIHNEKIIRYNTFAGGKILKKLLKPFGLEEIHGFNI